jgi:hypothetical protein
VTDPHQPATPAVPDGQKFTNVQEVAQTLGLGIEQQRF